MTKKKGLQRFFLFFHLELCQQSTSFIFRQEQQTCVGRRGESGFRWELEIVKKKYPSFY